MEGLTKLTAANLLERCPERIVTGNWNPEWAEIRRRLERLEQCEALNEYANHVFPCASLSGDGPCSCGYNAARAALEGK